MSAEGLCRFSGLGRFLFDRLCLELIALEAIAGAAEWHPSSAGSVLVLPEGLQPPGTERRLAGPTLVLSAWVRADAQEPAARVRAAIERTFDDWSGTRARSLLALTNVVLPEHALEGIEAEIVDARQLTHAVHSRPPLLMRLPSLLGICDERAIVSEDVRARSTADVDAAFALARVFVPTRAYAATVSVLERFGFAVLTGPPEMGKTAIARMVGLAKLSDGWEFHECIRPEELWERFAPGERQVFVADDAFGSTEYRPDAAERWAVELDRVLRAMDDRHWLLWTSRPAPLKAALRRIHHEHGVERFPQPAEVHVDASDLDVEEKALILFRHAKAAQLPQAAVDAVRRYGWTIVAHPHFTPERIRRFVSGRLLRADALAQLELEAIEVLIADEIREPTPAMAESFRALAADHRAVLVALLDVPPGPVPERDVAAAVRRHTATGFAQHPAVLLDRLTDHFVRIVEGGAVTWVHPSWRDLVIEELSADAAARGSFLRVCSLEGVLLAVSTGGGSSGARSLPLLVDDADWDAVTDRIAALVPDLDEPSVTRLLTALVASMTSAPSDELAAFATYTLDLLARSWDDRRRAVPVGLLARWLDLRLLGPDRPALPDIAATWIELLPTESALAATSAGAVADLEDWLMLVALLEDNEPDELKRLGFLPALAVRARAAAREIAAVPVLPEPEWYVPRELSPELRAILDAPPELPRSAERLVSQVLRDL